MRFNIAVQFLLQFDCKVSGKSILWRKNVQGTYISTNWCQFSIFYKAFHWWQLIHTFQEILNLFYIGIKITLQFHQKRVNRLFNRKKNEVNEEIPKLGTFLPFKVLNSYIRKLLYITFFQYIVFISKLSQFILCGVYIILLQQKLHLCSRLHHLVHRSILKAPLFRLHFISKKNERPKKTA